MNQMFQVSEKEFKIRNWMLTNLLEKVADLFIDSRTIPNVSTGGTAPSEAKKVRKGPHNNFLSHSGNHNG